MFKIGEFSKLTQVSIRMLRYYDEVGLLHPAKIDKFTGYRLYSIEQIPTLQKIILLRDLKFNVSEISTSLSSWNDNSIVAQLEDKKKELEDLISSEQRRLEKLKKAIKNIKQNNPELSYTVSFKSVPKLKILSLRKIIPTYNHEGVLWEELYNFIEDEKLKINGQRGNNIAIYHDEEHMDCNVDAEVGVIVNSFGKNNKGFIFRELSEVPLMACIMVYGSYENIGLAYKSFAYWLENHKEYKMCGPSRQICHIGLYDTKNPDEYLTEIQTPLTKEIDL